MMLDWMLFFKNQGRNKDYHSLSIFSWRFCAKLMEKKKLKEAYLPLFTDRHNSEHSKPK